MPRGEEEKQKKNRRQSIQIKHKGNMWLLVKRRPVLTQRSWCFVWWKQALAAWLQFYTKKECASNVLWKFPKAMIGCRFLLMQCFS